MQKKRFMQNECCVAVQIFFVLSLNICKLPNIQTNSHAKITINIRTASSWRSFLFPSTHSHLRQLFNTAQAHLDPQWEKLTQKFTLPQLSQARDEVFGVFAGIQRRSEAKSEAFEGKYFIVSIAIFANCVCKIFQIWCNFSNHSTPLVMMMKIKVQNLNPHGDQVYN